MTFKAEGTAYEKAEKQGGSTKTGETSQQIFLIVCALFAP